MMTTATALISEVRVFSLHTSFQRTIRSASESKRELVTLRKTGSNLKVIGVNMGNYARKSKENFQHIECPNFETA